MGVSTNHAMVDTKFSHLMLGFGSNLLLFCPVMSDDYQVLITLVSANHWTLAGL